MLNRIAEGTTLPVQRTHGRARCHADKLLVLIGDGSDAEAVLSYFCEMWPEVECADMADASAAIGPRAAPATMPKKASP